MALRELLAHFQLLLPTMQQPPAIFLYFLLTHVKTKLIGCLMPCSDWIIPLVPPTGSAQPAVSSSVNKPSSHASF